jgi:hypothetical protein
MKRGSPPSFCPSMQTSRRASIPYARVANIQVSPASVKSQRRQDAAVAPIPAKVDKRRDFIICAAESHGDSGASSFCANLASSAPPCFEIWMTSGLGDALPACFADQGHRQVEGPI